MNYKEALHRLINTLCEGCKIENPTECSKCHEAEDLVDEAVKMAIALEKTYMDIKPFMSIEEWKSRIYEMVEKEDKYRWHDIRKNPEDLPDDDRLVDCRTTDKQSAYYGRYIKNAKNGDLIDRWIDYEGFTMQVVAWREIEPFEEV